MKRRGGLAPAVFQRAVTVFSACLGSPAGFRRSGAFPALRPAAVVLRAVFVRLAVLLRGDALAPFRGAVGVVGTVNALLAVLVAVGDAASARTVGAKTIGATRVGSTAILGAFPGAG